LSRFNARTLLYLVLPPMMWAGNAVVGHLLVHQLPPVAMNALRWLIVAVILMPLAWKGGLRGWSDVRERWLYLGAIGVLGVGTYNTLQYLALKTSSPLNVTLIGASVPIWMMVVGAIGFGQAVLPRQLLGGVLSGSGVLLVIAKGRWETLRHVELVPGDLLMLLASLAWAIYSWMLAKPPVSMQAARRPGWDWAAFLQIQVMFGLLWAGLCTVAEVMLTDAGAATSMWPQGGHAWAALLFIAIGPSILAYRCWGLGVQAVGPTMAAFFGNLIPIFAALWSAMFLGQHPSWYHPVALLLIMAGIAASSRGQDNSAKDAGNTPDNDAVIHTSGKT
jgi:drug/metabolite transporter (DMT)-like permease